MTSRKIKFCPTRENWNLRRHEICDNKIWQWHVSIPLNNVVHGRAGFPAMVAALLSRERKTFTSMISHGGHDANEEMSLSLYKVSETWRSDETLSVSRTISGQRSISLLHLGRCFPRFSSRLNVHVVRLEGSHSFFRTARIIPVVPPRSN